jgi:hypothetical protein
MYDELFIFYLVFDKLFQFVYLTADQNFASAPDEIIKYNLYHAFSMHEELQYLEFVSNSIDWNVIICGQEYWLLMFLTFT